MALYSTPPVKMAGFYLLLAAECRASAEHARFPEVVAEMESLAASYTARAANLRATRINEATTGATARTGAS